MSMKKLWKDWGTIWFLEQFGLWANQPAAINLGYPKKNILADMQGRTVAKVRIDDDVAGFIHDSLNELGVRMPQHKEVLINFYIKRRTLEKSGESEGLKRTKTIEFLRSGEAWIDCKLNEYFKMSKAQREMMTLLMDEAS